MLKLHVNEGKRTVVAIVERNGLDAVEYVARRLGIKELEYTGDGSGEIKPMYLLQCFNESTGISLKSTVSNLDDL